MYHSIGIYGVRCFCDDSICLWTTYKYKRSAEKCYEKRTKSKRYKKVQLVLQNAVYLADDVLVLKEWMMK